MTDIEEIERKLDDMNGELAIAIWTLAAWGGPGDRGDVRHLRKQRDALAKQLEAMKEKRRCPQTNRSR